MVTQAKDVGKFSAQQEEEIKKNVERIEKAIAGTKTPQKGIRAFTGCDDDFVIDEVIRIYKEAGWEITHTEPEPYPESTNGFFELKKEG